MTGLPPGVAVLPVNRQICEHADDSGAKSRSGGKTLFTSKVAGKP